MSTEDHPLFGKDTSIKSIKQDIHDSLQTMQEKINYKGSNPEIKTPHVIEVTQALNG